ncbi:MAG: hypothetical protein ACKVQT_32580 [Burkholderiales bacterium]
MATGAKESSIRYLTFLLLFAVIIPAPAAHAQQEWMLLSRESGCGSLQMLMKMERLPQAPSSPDEFAAMMRARGHSVTVGLPEGFPNEMTGKAVMVKYAENRAPVFLRAELCGGTEKR